MVKQHEKDTLFDCVVHLRRGKRRTGRVVAGNSQPEKDNKNIKNLHFKFKYLV